MKTLKLLVAVLSLAAGTVCAQAPAQVDVAQKAAVKELLDAMNFKQMMSQMSGPMLQQMSQMFDQMIEATPSSSKLSPEQKAAARKAAQESSAKSLKATTELYNDPKVIEAFEDIMARAYAKNFTTAEIKATTAFYTSPAGKKALTIMPQMMQETMPEIMAVIAPRMSAIMESATKEVASQIKKGTDGSNAPTK